MQTSVVPQTKIEKMRRITRFLLVTVFATTLFGCSSSGDTGEKKGIALARANWNAGDGVVFVDVDGNRIIDSKQFNFAGKFSEGLCVVADKETGLCGFINEKGELVIPCSFPNPSNYVRFRGVEPRERARFHCGYARMGTSDGCVLIDRKGNTVLEGFVAIDWDGDVAIVSKDDMRMQGLYTMDGKEIVPIGTYNSIRFIGEDMLCCQKAGGGNCGIMDKTGKLLVDNVQELKETDRPYSKVGKFVDGYITVQMLDGSWRVMDKQGNVKHIFDKWIGNTRTFDGKMPDFTGRVAVIDGMLTGSNFEPIAEFPSGLYNISFVGFVDGMLKVSSSINEANYGFLNTKGEIAIPCQYKSATDFSEGLAFVKDDSGWHIIDKQGAVLGTLADKDIKEWKLGNFCAGRSVIGEQMVVDKNGNIVEMPRVTEIGDFYYSGNDNSELSEDF